MDGRQVLTSAGELRLPARPAIRRFDDRALIADGPTRSAIDKEQVAQIIPLRQGVLPLPAIVRARLALQRLSKAKKKADTK